MPVEFSRKSRVAANIRRVLGPALGRFLRDHGVTMAAITEVDVTPDLRHANVLVSVFETASKRPAIDALNENAGHFRRILGTEMRARRTPALKFALDDSIERGDRITRLIEDASVEYDPRG
jgi:ribosome-binding factor A